MRKRNFCTTRQSIIITLNLTEESGTFIHQLVLALIFLDKTLIDFLLIEALFFKKSDPGFGSGGRDWGFKMFQDENSSVNMHFLSWIIGRGSTCGIVGKSHIKWRDGSKVRFWSVCFGVLVYVLLCVFQSTVSLITITGSISAKYTTSVSVV